VNREPVNGNAAERQSDVRYVVIIGREPVSVPGPTASGRAIVKSSVP
jgi:hypothetical protein